MCFDLNFFLQKRVTREEGGRIFFFTRIKESLFASDIKMCTGISLGDVTFTRKQYMTNIA